jgi:hypothetical protein
MNDDPISDAEESVPEIVIHDDGTVTYPPSFYNNDQTDDLSESFFEESWVLPEPSMVDPYEDGTPYCRHYCTSELIDEDFDDYFWRSKAKFSPPLLFSLACCLLGMLVAGYYLFRIATEVF